MKRVVVVLASVALLASLATAGLIWLLSRTPTPKYPEISAYSRGQLVRIGPYFFCQPRNSGECDTPGTVGQLTVDDRDPVQLSLPPAIARSWWELRRDYGPQAPPQITEYLPGSDQLAVTIPTSDPARGRLAGITVQLKTLAVDQDGNELEWRHAEWSVATVRP
ncbi:MAG: DUF2771 domain-containing protein [Mycobacterium sp.]